MPTSCFLRPKSACDSRDIFACLLYVPTNAHVQWFRLQHTADINLVILRFNPQKEQKTWHSDLILNPLPRSIDAVPRDV
jgi:hypothetical protein